MLPPFPVHFAWKVALWKLRPGDRQDDYGKRAPRVTKSPEWVELSRRNVSKKKGRKQLQDAWLGAALDQLAQACGSFLDVTASAQTPSSAGKVTRTSPHVRIVVNVGDAINLCDTLITATESGYCIEDSGTGGESAGVGGTFPPVAFQQGSVQPMVLRADAFNEAGEVFEPVFDVINTSNLVDHLGESWCSIYEL